MREQERDERARERARGSEPERERYRTGRLNSASGRGTLREHWSASHELSRTGIKSRQTWMGLVEERERHETTRERERGQGGRVREE